MNEMIALQNYKFVLLRKKQMLILKKKIKVNTCNNLTKKKEKYISNSWGKWWGSWCDTGISWTFLEPSIALSIPRPSSFTIPPAVPGPGAAFSGTWSRAVPNGNNLIWDNNLWLIFCSRMIFVPFPTAAVQLPSKFPRYGLQVHEVAETASSTLSVEN